MPSWKSLLAGAAVALVLILANEKGALAPLGGKPKDAV
jgi:hypothetical protein